MADHTAVNLWKITLTALKPPHQAVIEATFCVQSDTIEGALSKAELLLSTHSTEELTINYRKAEFFPYGL